MKVELIQLWWRMHYNAPVSAEIVQVNGKNGKKRVLRAAALRNYHALYRTVFKFPVMNAAAAEKIAELSVAISDPQYDTVDGRSDKFFTLTFAEKPASNARTWQVRKSLSDFKVLDEHLKKQRLGSMPPLSTQKDLQKQCEGL